MITIHERCIPAHPPGLPAWSCKQRSYAMFRSADPHLPGCPFPLPVRYAPVPSAPGIPRPRATPYCNAWLQPGASSILFSCLVCTRFSLGLTERCTLLRLTMLPLAGACPCTRFCCTCPPASMLFPPTAAPAPAFCRLPSVAPSLCSHVPTPLSLCGGWRQAACNNICTCRHHSRGRFHGLTPECHCD